MTAVADGTVRSLSPAGGAADALRAVAHAAGADIAVLPRDESGTGGDEHEVARLARAAGLRLRRVGLTGGWWRTESDPAVGYRRDGRPVGLLPSPGGGYRLAGTDGTPGRRVDAAVDAELRPWADAVVRGLPDGPLRGRDLVRFGLRGSRRDLLAVLIAGSAGGLLALAIPVATGLLVAELIPAADRAGIVWVGLALAIAALAIAVSTLIRDLAVLRVETRLDASLVAAIWDRLLRLPAPFFRDFDAADLTRRALGIDSARQALAGTAASALLGLLFALPSAILLWLLAPWIALFALAAVAVGVVLFLVVGRATLGASRRFHDAAGRLAGITAGLVAGLPTLRVSGAEDRALAVWEGAFSAQQAAAGESQRAGVWQGVVATGLSRLTLAFVFLFAAQPISSLAEPAAFLMFYAAFGQLLTAAVGIGSAISLTARMLPAVERASPILLAVPEERRTGARHADPGALSGAVEVEGLGFRYPGAAAAALEDVSFRVEPGAFVAIVGASGAGKSTLFRLLLGFERPDSGAVRYDGRSLGALDVVAVRRQLGVVLQDAQLLAGELGANILGATALTEADAWEAARLVGLDAEIRAMPMGMRTFVAEGGGALSAGQRQRVLLARGIVRRPRLLLLDEATSALDAATQRLVTRSLASLAVTRIAIAHRLSTIEGADRILVMDHGRVVEQGTYAQLLAAGGRFAELAQRQLLQSLPASAGVTRRTAPTPVTREATR